MASRHCQWNDNKNMKSISTYILASLITLATIACKDTQSKVETVGDTTFAKKTFEALAQGDSKVAEDIDWPVFTSMGENVGAHYTAQMTSEEKQNFVQGYITQFATSFRENGGSVDTVTNWRVLSHDSNNTQVVADAAGGTLNIIVSERNGEERVSSITMGSAR